MYIDKSFRVAQRVSLYYVLKGFLSFVIVIKLTLKMSFRCQNNVTKNCLAMCCIYNNTLFMQYIVWNIWSHVPTLSHTTLHLNHEKKKNVQCLVTVRKLYNVWEIYGGEAPLREARSDEFMLSHLLVKLKWSIIL